MSVNYFSKIFTCSVQNLLTKNILIKNILLLFFIYFTISFNNKDLISPYQKIKFSLQIWIFIILFSKMNKYYISIIFLLLAIIYIINDFKNYYNYKIIDLYIQYISIIIFTLLISGIFNYYLNNKNNKNNKNLIDLFFGNNITCFK